jgi:hypothetical protein
MTIEMGLTVEEGSWLIHLRVKVFWDVTQYRCIYYVFPSMPEEKINYILCLGSLKMKALWSTGRWESLTQRLSITFQATSICWNTAARTSDLARIHFYKNRDHSLTAGQVNETSVTVKCAPLAG